MHASAAYGPENIVWNQLFVDIVGYTDDGSRGLDDRRFHATEAGDLRQSRSGVSNGNSVGSFPNEDIRKQMVCHLFPCNGVMHIALFDFRILCPKCWWRLFPADVELACNR